MFIQMEDPFASVLVDPFEGVKKEENPEALIVSKIFSKTFRSISDLFLLI